MGYLNSGQKPFELPEDVITKKSRKQIRAQNKRYYKLGMPKVKRAKRCSKCQRPMFKNHNCDTTKGKILTPQIKCINCDTLNVIGSHICHCCKKELPQ